MEHEPSRFRTTPSPQSITFEAILPGAMALRAEESGVKRVASDPLTVLI